MINTISNKLSDFDRAAYAKMQSLAVKQDANDKEKGAGAVEYGLVIAIVVTLVVGVAGVMAEPLEGFFEAAVNQVTQFLGGGG